MNGKTARRSFGVAVSLLLFLVLGAAALGSSGAAADSSFLVDDGVKLCKALPGSFPDTDLAGNPSCTDATTTGTPSDVTFVKSVPAGSSAFSSIVTFSPPGTTVTASATLGAGVKVGGAQVARTFGFANGPCNTLMTIDFMLYNIPLSPLAYPRPQGEFNRFGHWGPAPSTSPVDNMVSDGAGHALPTSPMFQGYPEFLNTHFGGVMPVALYGGATYAGNEWRVMFVAQFSAGALTTLSGAYSKMYATMGLPAVTFFDDPTTTLASNSGTTDMCSPVSMTTELLGTAVGAGARATTPAAAGTHFTIAYNASVRDFDQDGVDNANDTCPFATNTGDTDADALDNVCDPFPASPSAGMDEEGDGFVNALDNCPLTANGTTSQVDGESAAVVDLGPPRDQIGDACDAGPAVSVTQNNKTVTITPSSTVSNGRHLVQANVVAKCLGSTDLDGDGYCTAQDGQESGGCAGTVPPSCAVRHNSWPSSLRSIATSMDTDSDNWPDVVEGYLNSNEFCVTGVAHTPSSCGGSAFVPGVDAVHSCAQTTGAVGSVVNDERPWDNWPVDFNDNGTANTLDIATFVPIGATRLNKAVNAAPADERWDLNTDGIINTLDIGIFVQPPVQYLHHGCGGSSGTPYTPPVPAFSQQ